ncbi:unnamed protein product [Closterium sp. NIES-64]|nr:unnamed protein product [Closterium sp. NIES-64]
MSLVYSSSVVSSMLPRSDRARYVRDSMQAPNAVRVPRNPRNQQDPVAMRVAAVRSVGAASLSNRRFRGTGARLVGIHRAARNGDSINLADSLHSGRFARVVGASAAAAAAAVAAGEVTRPGGAVEHAAAVAGNIARRRAGGGGGRGAEGDVADSVGDEAGSGAAQQADRKGRERGGDASGYRRKDGEVFERGYSRRMVMALGISAGVAAGMGLTPRSAAAAAAAAEAGVGEGEGVSVGQRILRGLGFGDADVYYPRVFEGTMVFEGEWECLSQLIALETPQGEQAADSLAVAQARRDIGVTLPYRARFFEFNGNVVGDRAFTTTGATQQSLVEAMMGKGVVADADWSPSRPNQLTLTLKGGYKVQSVITRRSYEMSAPNQFDVFEYSQQVFDNPSVLDGPPSVKASSNLTRYQWDEVKATEQVKEIYAFQRVSMFPVVGGVAGEGQSRLSAADVISLGFGEKPVTVYKYLLRLTRA